MRRTWNRGWMILLTRHDRVPARILSAFLKRSQFYNELQAQHVSLAICLPIITNTSATLQWRTSVGFLSNLRIARG